MESVGKFRLKKLVVVANAISVVEMAGDKKHPKTPGVADKRFAHVRTDPRFKPIAKEKKTIAIDERFNAMFENKDFQVTALKDIRGGPQKRDQKEDLSRFYRLEKDEKEPKTDKKKEKKEKVVETKDTKASKEKKSSKSKRAPEPEPESESASESEMEEEEEGSELSDDGSDELEQVDPDLDSDMSDQIASPSSGSGSDGSDSSDSDVATMKMKKPKGGMIDIRGEGQGDSDSDASSDDSLEIDHEAEWESSESEGEKIEVTETDTNRLAMVNFDWEHVKAVDILVLLQSFAPPGGIVEKVNIYPSNFGLERMAYEEVNGPKMWSSDEDDKEKHPETEGDMQRRTRRRRKTADMDEDAPGGVDMDRLRKYQLSRLRYYVAEIICDTPATAASVYASCDGMEYERSSNAIDLRVISDDVKFTNPVKDSCSEAPMTYKPPEFHIKALQASNVSLTWDETPADRLAVTRRNLAESKDGDLDVREYLASASSDSNSEESNSDSDSDAKSKKNKKERSKYKDILKEIRGLTRDKSMEMEVTFTPGLSEKAEKAVENTLEEKSHKGETTWEKHQRELSERRHQRKLAKEAAREEEEEVASKPGKRRHDSDDEEEKRKEAAELELLMMKDDAGPKGFSVNNLVHDNKEKKSWKKRSKKERREAEKLGKEDEFKVDVADPRFSAVFERSEFAIDPSDPKFKKTSGMTDLLQERTKRHGEKLKREETKPVKSEGKSKKQELDSLVESVKRKATAHAGAQKKIKPSKD